MEKIIKQSEKLSKDMEKRSVSKYVITYQFDPNEDQICGVKIGLCPPDVLRTLSELATIHVPAISAFRREHPRLFRSVKLPIGNFDVEFIVVDKVRA